MKTLLARIFPVFAFTLALAFGLEPASAAPTETATASVEAAAPKPPPGFVPVPGGKPKADEVDAARLVILAYAAFAIAFVAYLVHVARTQSRLAKEIHALGERIDRSRPEG